MATILESNQGNTPDPLTDRERQWVSQLRVLLKDVPQENTHSLDTLVEDHWGERWNDMQLLMFLNQSLSQINAEPPLTANTLEDAPEPWKGCVLNGGMVYALIAEGVLQNGEQFSYGDNGISLSVNLTGGYTSIAQMLLQSYRQQITNIKRAFRPTASAVIDGGPPVRIRSYAPRMWTYR